MRSRFGLAPARQYTFKSKGLPHLILSNCKILGDITVGFASIPPTLNNPRRGASDGRGTERYFGIDDYRRRFARDPPANHNAIVLVIKLLQQRPNNNVPSKLSALICYKMFSAAL